MKKKRSSRYTGFSIHFFSVIPDFFLISYRDVYRFLKIYINFYLNIYLVACVINGKLKIIIKLCPEYLATCYLGRKRNELNGVFKYLLKHEFIKRILTVKENSVGLTILIIECYLLFSFNKELKEDIFKKVSCRSWKGVFTKTTIIHSGLVF